MLRLSSRPPSSFGLACGGISNNFPDIASIEVNLAALGEVEVFGPGMAVTDDEFYWFPSTATVVDVLTGDVMQDGCPLQDFL